MTPRLFLVGASFTAVLAAGAADVPRPDDTPLPDGGGFGANIRLGGEAGAGLFDTGARGAFPNHEFRIDEARLFLDAKLLDNVFFFTELNLVERESLDDGAEIGEVYVDVEDVQALWGGTSPLTLRVGRMDIPFGEEYLSRDAVDNPFISHTLADIWGVDEGVELFGRAGPVDYALAVQNGGFRTSQDGDPDKSVAARAGIRPLEALRLSASAMRTGDLSVQDDMLSEVWFGNAYIGSRGDPEATTAFNADLGQVDAAWTWRSGRAAAAVGGLRYDDDDRAADNSRDALFWSAEVVQYIIGRWYAGVRYSRIRCADGFAVPGQAAPADYDDEAPVDVEHIGRLSAVVGHRWNARLVWKAEYSLERGDRPDGTSVADVDMVATMVACGF